MHYRCMAEKLRQKKWDCKSQNFKNAHKDYEDKGYKFYPQK